MPDFGTPVAQNVKGPDLSTLSGILDIQQKQQSLASGAIGIQRAQQQLTGTGANEAQLAQQTMQERGVITKMMQSGKDDKGNSVMGADGEHDLSKLLPALGRMAPLTGQHVAKTILDTHQAKLGVQTAGLSLDSNQRNAVMGVLQSAAANPTDPAVMGNISKMLDSLGDANPGMSKLIGNVKTTLLPHMQSAKPEERAKMANSMAAMLQGGQAVQTQPQGAAVNDGQTLQQGTTAPPVAGGGFTPKTSTQQQLPPTTPVMRNGVPGYKGDANVASGPALGQAAGVEGPVATNNAHFAQVQTDAATASTRMAALQTIKSEAPAAVTGGGDYRRKFISQISGLFGFANDAQTATDVMAKNLSVLAAQSGNTDAARSLGEMANPSYHMTVDAAKKTADQLMGIEAKKVAAQKLFTGTPTSSPEYGKKLQEWNAHSDPRAFEYARKSPTDRAVMKAEMVKAGTWDEVESHGLALHKLGATP